MKILTSNLSVQTILTRGFNPVQFCIISVAGDWFGPVLLSEVPVTLRGQMIFWSLEVTLHNHKFTIGGLLTLHL